MRYAIFSDVHSNLEAFESVLDALKNERIDKYLFAGDIVGYGANPTDCIKLLKQVVPSAAAGNHDWGVAGKFELDYFNAYAQAAIRWTQSAISDADKEYLADLNLIYESEELAMVHGTLDEPSAFKYIFDLYNAEPTIRMLKGSICFVGHSHIPAIFVAEGECILHLRDYESEIYQGKKYIVNVGSVGQPRDGDPRAAFCVYDTGQKKIEIKRVSYDIEKAQGKIIAAGLPKVLAYRLTQGR